MSKSIIKSRKIDYKKIYRSLEDQQLEDYTTQSEGLTNNRINERVPLQLDSNSTDQIKSNKDYQNQQLNELKSKLMSPNYNSNGQFPSGNIYANNSSSKIGKPYTIQSQSNQAVFQKKDQSSRQQSYKNLHYKGQDSDKQDNNIICDTTFHTAIQILKKNPSQIHNVLILERQLQGEDESDNFEQVIQALNVAAKEYLQAQDKQKAMQIINFSYETCIIEQVNIELQAETMLNYCLIAKKNKEYNSSIQMINKCLNFYQDHPLLINIGVAYSLYSQILRKQNKQREALEMSKKAVFYSEQKYKLTAKRYDNGETNQQTLNYLKELQVQIASAYYYQALCEASLQNKKGAISLIQSAISKVTQVLGSSNQTTVKYIQKLSQLNNSQFSVSDREERAYSGFQNETISSSTSSFNKKNKQNQIVVQTVNESINEEYQNILYNKSNRSINQHYPQNSEMDELRNQNNSRQRPGSSMGNNSQTIRIQAQQQRPQSGKPSLGKKVFIGRRSLFKNNTNDQAQTLKNLLKQDQQLSENKPIMYQDFSYTSPIMKQKSNILSNRSTEAEFFQESREDKYVDKIRFLQETVKSQQQDIEKLKRQNGYLQIKIFDHENSTTKVSTNSKQVTNLNTQMEELQKKFNELIEKSNKSEKEYQSEIDKLQVTLKDRSEVLKKVLDNNQNDVKKYEEKIAKMIAEQEKKERQTNDQICTFELTISKNQLQINTLKSEIKEQSENQIILLSNKDKEIQKLNSQMVQKEEYYQSELQKYQKSSSEISDYVKKANQLEQELKKIKEDKELVDQALLRYRDQTADMMTENSTLQQRLSQANTELKGKDVIINQQEDKIKILTDLNNQASNNSKLNEQLEKEKKDLSSQLNRIQEENKRLQNQLDQAKREVEEKEELLLTQKNSNIVSNEKENELQKENNDLKEKLSQSMQKNEELAAQLQATIINSNQDKIQIAQLQLDFKQTEDKFKNLEQNFNLLKRNNTTFDDIKTKQIYSEDEEDDEEPSNNLDASKSRLNSVQALETKKTEPKSNLNLNDSVADIQRDLNFHKSKKILVLQQFHSGFNALLDFQFHCQSYKLTLEKKGELVLTIDIQEDILQVFYTSKNFFIFSKILRRFAISFLYNSLEQFTEEFIFDVDDMSFQYVDNIIKYDSQYFHNMIQKLPEQVLNIFKDYQFFSNEASDQKIIELSKKQVTVVEQKEKKTINFGEAMVQCDQTQEKVPVKFIYDVKKQILDIKPSNPNIQGLRICIKKEETQKWIVQNKLISLDKQIRAIKMEHVRFLKQSIKRYHLFNRVFSTYISLNHQDQKVNGVLTIFKGIQNSFVYIKTLNKEKNNKSFYQISMNDKSFEKLKEISKQYIIDQCQFNYERGIIWMKKDLGIQNIYPTLENVVYSGLIKISYEEISQIRQKKGLKDEMHIVDEQNDIRDDMIQIVVKKIDDTLTIQPLWDLPILQLKQTIEPTLKPEQIKQLSKNLIKSIKVDYDFQKSMLQLIQSDQNEMSETEELKPTSIFRLDCLNQTLRKSQNHINTSNITFIDAIEVPDHTAKSTCKLQILLNIKTSEYLIRSYLKQVHEIKIPAHNLSKEKLLKLYYFYFEQNTIKYLKKQMLEKVIYQMRRFRIMNKLKFYQIKTKTGQFGDLVLFQGIKSTIIILKIMFKSRKDQIRKLFVIQETNLEHIIENINEIIQLLNQHIVNIYQVLSYRQVENQFFQFYSIAGLWDQYNKEIILKADDLSIPPVVFKKPKLSYRQALFQAEELLQQAILYKDPKTGLNQIDI